MNWHTATPAERAADWTLLRNGDLRDNATGEVWHWHKGAGYSLDAVDADANGRWVKVRA